MDFLLVDTERGEPLSPLKPGNRAALPLALKRDAKHRVLGLDALS